MLIPETAGPGRDKDFGRSGDAECEPESSPCRSRTSRGSFCSSWHEVGRPKLWGWQTPLWPQPEHPQGQAGVAAGLWGCRKSSFAPGICDPWGLAGLTVRGRWETEK